MLSVAGLQVSAGYDAHWRDPLAGLQMRSSTYYRLAHKIKALADSLSGRGSFTCLHADQAKQTRFTCLHADQAKQTRFT